MDKPKITAKDFFLWAGAMVALYWSVIAFIFLVFNYIDYAFPDALSYYPSDPYQSGIGYEMASIVVLFPIYLIVMWVIRRSIQSDPSRKDIWARRWALILTLFVAGITMAVDLIEVLSKFFNGESLTEAFLLKVLLIFLIAAAIFMHFIADLWGYWEQYPSRKMSVGIAVIILAIVTVISGFFILGTPAQAREYQMDEQRVSDLQNIQSEIVTYWQQENKLPATLADLNDSISGYSVPVDPGSGAPYQYQELAGTSFELCAIFSAETQSDSASVSAPMMPAPVGVSGQDLMSDSWYHTAGDVCFNRTIDPSRYPPIPKTPVQ